MQDMLLPTTRTFQVFLGELQDHVGIYAKIMLNGGCIVRMGREELRLATNMFILRWAYAEGILRRIAQTLVNLRVSYSTFMSLLSYMYTTHTHNSYTP